MKRIIMAACIVSLAACGGDKDDVASGQREEWEAAKASLVYSFPDHQQQQVPVPSPVVLRFSSPVTVTTSVLESDVELRDSDGNLVAWDSVEEVDGGKSLIFTPAEKFDPQTEYVLSVPAIALQKGEAAARTISFSTRASYDGARSEVAQEEFKILRAIPDGDNFPVMDFSTFRLQFSQPLDKQTVRYGNGPNDTLQVIGPQGLVEAHVLVSGSYLTIDPKEDLQPGVEYSLVVTTSLASVYGDTMPGGSFGNPGDTQAARMTFSPQDTTAPGTGQRVSMIQDVADTGKLSPLTGKPINLVPMSSVLLGNDTATQAKSVVAAELAFVPNFPEKTPFRVKRGSLIEGASIEVLIGGEVPAGFDSGKVRMDFLSDATGYLLPNPYSDADDAPRQVRLFMDVAVSTETPSANGAITQDLMHIELVGTAIVEDGVMVINAVGVVEPDVLASERATGILSFYMEAFDDQDNAPTPVQNNEPIVLQSWSHEETGGLNIDQPIVINFNKPVNPESVSSETVVLLENDMYEQRAIAVKTETRGSAIVVTPSESLRASYEVPGATIDDVVLNDVQYTLVLSGEISDIHGMEVGADQNLEFSFAPRIAQVNWLRRVQFGFFGVTSPVDPSIAARFNQPVVLLAAYPGYPCPIDTTEQDLSNGIQGRCLGSLSEAHPGILEIKGETGDDRQARAAADLLPVAELPQNGKVIVVGSKEFDHDSVRLNSTFKVERLDPSGSPQEAVDGVIQVEGGRIVFTPEKPWQVGEYYRYTLTSNGDNFTPGPAICDGTQAICDINGMPLQTRMYSVSTPPASLGLLRSQSVVGATGGPDFSQIFKAVPKRNTVVQVLSSSSVDQNANFYHDVGDGVPPDYQGYMINNDIRGYANEENGVDPSDLEDDGSIKLIPNTARLLSGTQFSPAVPARDENGDVIRGDKGIIVLESGYSILGLNVGCGWFWPADVDPDNEDEVYSMTDLESRECPELKHTYLTSALIAEVTDEYVEGQGIKVLIWPGQIFGTSASVWVQLGSSANAMDSGKQLMRMRFAKDDENCVETPQQSCLRTKPIIGWIQDESGKPVMSASVDLTIEAPALSQSLAQLELDHNIVNVPVTMELSGEISFAENGQMIIEQRNTNEVRIPFELGGVIAPNAWECPGPLCFDAFPQKYSDFELIVPEGGSYLQYKSDLIH